MCVCVCVGVHQQMYNTWSKLEAAHTGPDLMSPAAVNDTAGKNHTTILKWHETLL